MYAYSLYTPPHARPAPAQYATRTCTSTAASLPQEGKACTDVKKYPYAGDSTEFLQDRYPFSMYSGGSVTLKE